MQVGGKLGGDGSVCSDPISETILAVPKDSSTSLMTVIWLFEFTRNDWGVVDELNEVLAVASNDSDLLAVFSDRIELIGIGSLDLFTSGVGQLGLGDEGHSLSTDKLLLQDKNLGRVGLFVLEPGNLVVDFSLAWDVLASD